MYRIDNTAFAIREIQRFLLTVSQIQPIFPDVAVDGIFGEETRLAVKEFQRLYLLPQTGSVDKDTFNALFLEHSRILDARDSRNEILGKEDFPLKLGSWGENVTILHAMLSQLGEYYDLSQNPTGDFYSRETETVIKQLQQLFMTEIDGETDELLWKKIRTELKAREKFKKDN